MLLVVSFPYSYTQCCENFSFHLCSCAADGKPGRKVSSAASSSFLQDSQSNSVTGTCHCLSENVLATFQVLINKNRYLKNKLRQLLLCCAARGLGKFYLPELFSVVRDFSILQGSRARQGQARSASSS